MKPPFHPAGGPRFVVALFTCLILIIAVTAQAADLSDFIRWDLKESPTAPPDLHALLHVPSGYTASQSYPIIVFYHGATEIVSNGTNGQINGNIDQLLIKAKANNAFLLAPQAKANWNPDNTQQTMQLVAAAMRQYNIDPNKIYLTGLSLGGGATWLTLDTARDIAAASVPVCGVKTAGTLNPDGSVSETFAAKLVGKNIWAFHASNDGTVDVRDAREYISKVLAAGGVTPPTFPTGSYPGGQNFYSSGNLRYTEYQTGGHGIWSTVYSTTDMYTWLFAKANSGLDLQAGEKIFFHFGNLLPINDGSYPFWNAARAGSYKLPSATIAFARTGSNRQTKVSLHTTGTFDTDKTGNSLPTNQGLYGNNGGNSGWGTTNHGTGTLVINGLVAGANYTVSAFAANGATYVSNTTRFLVNGTAKDLTVLNNTGSTATFSTNSSTNGDITISVIGTDTGWGDLAVTGYLNTLTIARNTGPADTQAPVVDITSPTNLSTYSTSDAVVNLAGTALDNNAVTTVSWENSRGGNGTATNITNWMIGNVPLVTGTNVITVSAYDAAGNRGFDTLTVNYSGPVPNQPPVTTSGTSQTITLPTNSVTLNGSVTDDGLSPGNPTPTATWSKVSGPGTVAFGNANAASTTATFSASGTYVLRLTGSDGALSSTSDVTIIVQPAPTPTPTPSPTPSGTTSILTPTAWGIHTTAGNYVDDASRMFNNQPTWDAVNGTPIGGDTGTGAAYIKAGWDAWRSVVYIDFGPDWANKRIQQAWTKYITARSDAADPYFKLWWDNNQDNISDVAAGNIAETVLNFDTKAHSGGEWKKDVDVSSAPITPKGRYLKMVGGDYRSDDPNEYAFVGYTVSGTPPSTVIPVTAWGSVIAGGAVNASGMFNAQPTWSATTGAPVGGDTAGGSTGYFKAGWDTWQNKVYIDFGPNWQNVRIQQTWTKYIVSRTGVSDPYLSAYWDDDNDNTMDSGAGNAIGEPTLNFDSQPHVGGDWVKDVDVTTAPITPKGRYLILTEGVNRSDQPNELAIIGYIVTP